MDENYSQIDRGDLVVTRLVIETILETIKAQQLISTEERVEIVKDLTNELDAIDIELLSRGEH